MNDFGSSITFDNFNNSYDEKESEIPYESLFNLFLILRDSSPRNCNLCQNATDDRIFSGCCQETFCRPCIDTYLKFSIACPDCSSPFTFYFCDVGINVKNYKALKNESEISYSESEDDLIYIQLESDKNNSEPCKIKKETLDHEKYNKYGNSHPFSPLEENTDCQDHNNNFTGINHEHNFQYDPAVKERENQSDEDTVILLKSHIINQNVAGTDKCFQRNIEKIEFKQDFSQEINNQEDFNIDILKDEYNDKKLDDKADSFLNMLCQTPSDDTNVERELNSSEKCINLPSTYSYDTTESILKNINTSESYRHIEGTTYTHINEIDEYSMNFDRFNNQKENIIEYENNVNIHLDDCFDIEAVKKSKNFKNFDFQELGINSEPSNKEKEYSDRSNNLINQNKNKKKEIKVPTFNLENQAVNNHYSSGEAHFTMNGINSESNKQNMEIEKDSDMKYVLNSSNYFKDLTNHNSKRNCLKSLNSQKDDDIDQSYSDQNRSISEVCNEKEICDQEDIIRKNDAIDGSSIGHKMRGINIQAHNSNAIRGEKTFFLKDGVSCIMMYNCIFRS